jgi:hypothetical protein
VGAASERLAPTALEPPPASAVSNQTHGSWGTTGGTLGRRSSARSPLLILSGVGVVVALVGVATFMKLRSDSEAAAPRAETSAAPAPAASPLAAPERPEPSVTPTVVERVPAPSVSAASAPDAGTAPARVRPQPSKTVTRKPVAKPGERPRPRSRPGGADLFEDRK